VVDDVYSVVDDVEYGVVVVVENVVVVVITTKNR
jgi:hypothetical protein